MDFIKKLLYWIDRLVGNQNKSTRFNPPAFGSNPKRCIFFQSKSPLLKFLYLNHCCCCCWFWEGDLTGMPRQFSGHKLELNRREKKINIADARPWFLWHQYSFYDGQAPELECTVWLSQTSSRVRLSTLFPFLLQFWILPHTNMFFRQDKVWKRLSLVLAIVQNESL